MWYLRSLERAGVIQKLPILEHKNGLVLFNTRVPVSGTSSILFPKRKQSFHALLNISLFWDTKLYHSSDDMTKNISPSWIHTRTLSIYSSLSRMRISFLRSWASIQKINIKMLSQELCFPWFEKKLPLNERFMLTTQDSIGLLKMLCTCISSLSGGMESEWKAAAHCSVLKTLGVGVWIQPYTSGLTYSSCVC